jgi:hypothetical protein
MELNLKFLQKEIEFGMDRDRVLLRAGLCGCRIPVRVRFSTPIQTGPRAYPASYIMGTGSYPGVKRPGRGVDHLPHLTRRLKKE